MGKVAAGQAGGSRRRRYVFDGSDASDAEQEEAQEARHDLVRVRVRIRVRVRARVRLLTCTPSSPLPLWKSSPMCERPTASGAAPPPHTGT